MSKLASLSAKRREVFDYWGWGDGTSQCWYCGVELLADEPWHVEHQHPRCRGGADDTDNLVPACVDCNRRKATATVEEFRVIEWERRKRVLGQVFEILQDISGQDALFIYRLWDDSHLDADDVIREVGTWISDAGPAGVRFSGDTDGYRFLGPGESLERATLGIMRGMAGLPLMAKPRGRYDVG